MPHLVLRWQLFLDLVDEGSAWRLLTPSTVVKKLDSGYLVTSRLVIYESKLTLFGYLLNTNTPNFLST